MKTLTLKGILLGLILLLIAAGSTLIINQLNDQQNASDSPATAPE